MIIKSNPFAYGTILVIFFYSLVFPQITESTAIITIRTPTEIIIGADSFLGDTHHNTIGVLCKIQQARDVFLAVSGVPLAQGTGIDFDIYKIAIDIFSRNIPIQDRISTYDAIIKWHLIKIIDIANREKELVDFIYNREDKFGINIIIALNGPDFPIFYNIKHFVASTSNEPPIIKSTISNFTDQLGSDIDIMYSGQFAEQDRRACSQIISRHNIDNLFKPIRECIELIAKTSPVVKLPVDILRITNRGAQWIQHKDPECKEIQ